MAYAMPGQSSSAPSLPKNVFTTSSAAKTAVRSSARKRLEYFDNDMNVQRFVGIFSAHYCWPQDSEDNGKCWSAAMTDSYEWFRDRLWPQVVDKVPLITADDSARHQITELLFAFVLKETDLLTDAEALYYESVLDLFNDEIAFGVMFWLKMCSHFNWRRHYVKLVARHQRCRELLDVLCRELTAHESAHCLTADELQYFYSVVDSVCVQTIASNVLNGKSGDNRYFIDLQKTVEQNVVNRKDYKPLMRQLPTFIVLIEELIGFAFTLIPSDGQTCGELSLKMLTEMDDLFGHSFKDTDVSDDHKYHSLPEDLIDARSVQKSLDLVNKRLNESNVELKSLKKFFRLIDKTLETLPSNRFPYFSDILRDDSHKNHRKLMDLLLSFGDYNEFKELIESVAAEDVVRYECTVSVAKRLISCSKNPMASDFYRSLLYKTLEVCPHIDLKRRIDAFGLKPIGECNSAAIKTLFNRLIETDTDVINQLVREIMIGAYFDGLQTLDQLLIMALEHSKVHKTFVARVLVNELNPWSTAEATGKPILYALILHRIRNKTSLQTIDDMTKLIALIIDVSAAEKMPPIVSLDQLFLYVISDKNVTTDDGVYAKFLFIKSLAELTPDDKWPAIQSDPVPVIVYLMQYMDSYWRQPHRKQLVIELLDLFLAKKFANPLTDEEFGYLEAMMSQTFNRYDHQKASTYKIYMVYCERLFPKPIADVINISENIFHDQILHYAIATRDTAWISAVYPEYNLFTQQLLQAIAHIMPALTANEWLSLFKFLQLYYYNYEIVCLFRKAIRSTPDDTDRDFLTKCFVNIIKTELIIPSRDDVLIRPLTQEDFQYYELDWAIMFKTLASLEHFLLPTDMRAQLCELMTELAERMQRLYICPYDYYKEEKVMPRVAKEVTKKVFGSDIDVQYIKQKDRSIGLTPAGAKR